MGVLTGALHQNLEAFAQVLMQEQGKPITAAREEVRACLHWCQTFVAYDLPVEIIEKE